MALTQANWLPMLNSLPSMYGKPTPAGDAMMFQAGREVDRSGRRYMSNFLDIMTPGAGQRDPVLMEAAMKGMKMGNVTAKSQAFNQIKGGMASMASQLAQQVALTMPEGDVQTRGPDTAYTVGQGMAGIGGSMMGAGLMGG